MKISEREIKDLLNEAARLGNLKKFYEAISYYEKVLSIDPDIEDAYIGKGMALSCLGFNEEAMRFYKQALNINSNSTEAMRFLARSLAKLRKINESIKIFDTAISLEPNNFLLWYDKGVTCSNNGLTQMAIKCYKEVTKLNPSYYDVWFNLGMTHAQLGKYDQSLQYLDKSLEMNPMDQKVKQYRDMIAREKVKFGGKKYYAEETDEGLLINIGDGSKEAIEGGLSALYRSLYKKQQEGLDKNSPFYDPTFDANDDEDQNLIEGESEQNKETKNASVIEKENEINDLLNIALEIIKVGQFDEAISNFKKVLQIDPNNIIAWGWIGQAHYQLKQFEEANECYKNAIINFEAENNGDDLLNPIRPVTYQGLSFNMLEIWDNRGDSLIMLNKYDEGIKCYEKVLNIEPDRLKTLQNMTVALKTQGKLKEALKCSIRLLQLDPENSKLKKTKISLENDIKLTNLVTYPVKIQDLVKKSLKLYKSEDYEECIEICDRVLQDFPDLVLAWYYKAWSLKLISKDEEAMKCLHKLLEIDQDYVDASNLMGIIYRNRCNFDKALERYNHVLRLDPTIWEAWNNKGNVYVNIGQFEKALECFDEALKYESNSIKILVNKSLLLEEMNKSEEAQKYFNLAKKSNTLQALYEKANSLKQRERYNEALKYYDEILKIEPNNSNIVHQRIYILTRLKTDKRIETYQELKKKGVNNLNEWIDNGMLLASVGEFKDAIDCFEEAIRIDPTNVNCWLNKANVLAPLKRWNEAIECYDQILQDHPKLPNAWYNKSVTLSLIGRFEEALICADNAIKFDKKNISAYHNKSVVLQGLKRYEEALNTIEKVIKMDPNASIHWFKKGNILFQLKKFDKAIECFDKVLNGDPKFEFYEQAQNNKDKLIFLKFRQNLIN